MITEPKANANQCQINANTCLGDLVQLFLLHLLLLLLPFFFPGADVPARVPLLEDHVDLEVLGYHLVLQFPADEAAELDYYVVT